VKVEKLDEGRHLFHFDQVASGFCRLRVRDVEPGRRITLQYGYARHGINQRFGNQNEDVYICRGSAEETWEKEFGYGLIRYVQVTNYPGEPTADDLTFLVVHNDMPRAGSFACSKEVVNDIWRALEWTYRSNYHSVPVDCDREKIYWPFAAGSFDVGAATWQFDLSRFVPRMFRVGGGPGKGLHAAGWGEGAIFHPFRAWMFYGDRRFAEREYEHMKLMMERRLNDANGPAHYHGGFGDWHGLNRKQENGGMFGAVYHYGALWQLSCMAEWLGEHEDAARYREMLSHIAAHFSEALLDRERMTYPGDNQRALALPLAVGFVPDWAQPQIEERFMTMVSECDRFLREQESVVPTPYETLRERCLESGGESLDYHPTIGLYAQPLFLWALTTIGRHDVAYQVVSQTSYPSWGHMAREGTAMAEGYGAGYSHLGRASIGAWIFETLCGIRPHPDYPGFKRFIVRPEPAGDLRWAKATHKSPYGTIESHWRIEEGHAFALDLTVPPNSTAVVYLPAEGKATEGGQPVASADGVCPAEPGNLPTYWWAALPRDLEGREAAETHRVYEVVAGHYSFRVSPVGE
jgi:alpha-L-rhamnosidase